MPTTTLKVDTAIRDRLASVAKARGTTMVALLAEVADRLAVEQRWLDIHAAYERLRHDDPSGWTEYTAELDEWDAGTSGPDSAAAAEWPELNS